MTQRFSDEGAELLRFGGGRNSRASEDQIHPLECTDGENFILDPGNGELRPRPPFDLVGTAPNGSEIRGFVSLQKTDGTVSMLVQAGSQVYQWDGATFTAVGSVDSSAKIRGQINANWALDDRVLITDINLAEEIHEWDGTTFSQVAFAGATSFRARYCVVENERAFFGNLYENGSPFPHLLVASQRGDYKTVSIIDRPSSSLGLDAPWFLPTPQLKPINGMAFAYGILAISQEKGAFEKLEGTNSQNFSLSKLHDGSGASGRESVVSTSNDIIYGSSGHIESLQSTDKFGNVEFDDLSFMIQPDIKDYNDWNMVYNPRLRRTYCFPTGSSEVHVLHTDFIQSDLSPWSKWTTQHPFSFQSTATLLCRDPIDGLEYVFMGDANGNLYKLEGVGLAGDGGTDNIITKRTSKLYSANLDAKAFNINGWLQHRKRLENTVSVKFLFAGHHVHDVMKTVELSAIDFDTVYNDEIYYGGNFYYGPRQENRLVRRTLSTSGQANSFQIETKVEGNNEFALTEIGLRYDQAS